MSGSQEQHAIRRSTRLPLEIPVRVTSLDPRATFSQPCKTTLVNAHGCGLTIACEVPRGIQVRLEIVSAKRHTTAHVAEVVPLGGDPESWLLGLELDVPGNFWGIEYAPADWKIDDTDSTLDIKVPEHETAPDPHAIGRRWRLTDISSGACYLETANPFPLDTAVLVSIRVAKSEFLLDGIVRASYPQSGMGVEFTPRPLDHTARIEKLIAALTSHREVPRIFVGRKEHPEKEHQADVGLTDTPLPDDDDPLLQLIRRANSLAMEQFIDDLKAQRLGNRGEERIEIALPVLLSGSDVNGRPIDQRVTTVNVSQRGALLTGVHGTLRKGDKVFLARAGRKEEFRVAWIGSPDGQAADQIGVMSTAPTSALWREALQSVDQASRT